MTFVLRPTQRSDVGVTFVSHFAQVLDLVQNFITMGEAFTRAEATGLRGHVQRMSATFFAAKQRRQLDVLCMMLEKEMWQRLPQEAVPQIRQVSL